MGVEWHPLEPSKFASCGWDGTIKTYDWFKTYLKLFLLLIIEILNILFYLFKIKLL